jgi:hypothetical protein
MDLKRVQLLLNKGDRTVRSATRRTIAILIIFILTGIPTHAEPIGLTDVVQTLNTRQGSVDLRIRNILQGPGSSGLQDPSAPAGTQSKSPTGSEGGTKPDSLLSGFVVGTETPQIGVEVVEEAIVEGSICDCGEILLPAGAWPKWPLLFLAAVPLFFIDDDDDERFPTPTPTPTPPVTPTPTPPPQIPEPASLFLFGTGLLAFATGMRRRYLTKHKAQIETKGKE